MPDWMVINYFYNGLGPQLRPMLDAASGGFLWAKSYNEAYELIEMMAANEYQNPTQRLHQRKAAGILDVDATTALTAQLKALIMKVDSLANLGNQQPPSVCELCSGAHSSDQCAICSESAQFVSNFQRSQQPAASTYHPNNRNHPNFNWSNNQNFMPQQQQRFQQQRARPFNPSGFQQQFAPKQQFHPPGFQQQNHGVAGQSSNERSEWEEMKLMIKSQAVSIKTLENQIGRIADALINRPQGTLPSDTEADPGKKEMKEQGCQLHITPDNGVKQVYPPPPFPKRLQKHKLDKQFAKFLEVFRKLQINITFAEALEQMPSYAKFMKGILSLKLKLEDLETIALTEECSAVLQQKLPPKLKDPRSFTISCTIGPLSFDKCLCDLGASINLMPLSVFKKLGLPEPKPTNMYLQLAVRSITYPRVFNAMKFPSDEEECFKVEPIEAAAHSEIDQRLKTNILEKVLTGEAEFGDDEEAEKRQFLNASS
ncbi:uncharacterized protein LOC135149505 [Daucus carota subsp. sativus]|uniref:uncharacterized protein LOC135149505 n=1 Tax=Daucus carota subsp. sativus TaxID=79200 RepID=UPI0030831DE1